MVEFIGKRTIKLDRILSDLDRFVLDFVKILEKHADYVIVSGYVSILFGRTRATEDIDVFIKKLSKEEFDALYRDLKKSGYWCLNSGNVDEIYDYLDSSLAVRFAIKNQTIPNFEIKFAIKKLNMDSLKDTITVMIKSREIRVSSFERQIAFKKYYLKSDKDLEDARHIEELFKEHIDKKEIENYKRLIENEMAQTRKK